MSRKNILVFSKFFLFIFFGALLGCVARRNFGGVTLDKTTETVQEIDELVLPQELFEQYLLVNRVAPQSNFFIELIFLRFLLSHDLSMDDFLDARLSHEQLQQLGAAMDASHKAYGVGYAMNWKLRKELDPLQSLEVAPARLIRLIEGLKGGSLVTLAAVRRALKGQDFFEMQAILKETKDVAVASVGAELFLTEPEFAQSKSDLGEVVELVYRTFKGKDFLGLLGEWRSEIARNRASVDINGEKHQKLLLTLRDMVLKSTSKRAMVDLLFRKFASTELAEFLNKLRNRNESWKQESGSLTE